MPALSVEAELHELRKKVSGYEQERGREQAKRNAAWTVVKALSPSAHAFDRNLRTAHREAEAAQLRVNTIERELRKLQKRIDQILNPGFGFGDDDDDEQA